MYIANKESLMTRPQNVFALLTAALIGIAGDNDVTLDWIMLRAIKVYVEEYRRTGKL